MLAAMRSESSRLDAFASRQDVPLPSTNQGSKKRHWMRVALALIQDVLHSSPDGQGLCVSSIDCGSFLSDLHNAALIHSAPADAVVPLFKGHTTMSTQVHAAVKRGTDA